MFHKFGTLTTIRGDALPAWQVEAVLVSDGTTVVPIYSDESGTPIASVSKVANRAITDDQGNYDFFVAEGNYSLRYYNTAGVFQRMDRYVNMDGRKGDPGAKGEQGDPFGPYFTSKANGETARAVGQGFSYSDGAGGLIYAERTANGAGDAGGNSKVIAQAATKAQIDSKVATADLASTAAGKGASLVKLQSGRSVEEKASDFVSVKDFGGKGDGVADDSAAVAAAAADAIATKRALYFPAGTYLVDSVAFAVTPDSNNAMLSITGDGPHASKIVRRAGAGRALVDVSSSAVPTEAHVYIAGLAIDGLDPANGDTGLKMTGIANWRLENVLIDRCDIGLDLAGSLTGSVGHSSIKRGRIGIRTRTSGGVYCNAVTVENSRIKYNTERGLDIGGASLFRLIGGTVEENGTAANTATGGMIVRSDVASETGLGLVEIDGTHFELNKGWQFDAEAMAGGNLLSLLVEAVPFLSSESNRAMRVAGADFVKLEGVEAAGAGDIVNVTATRLAQIGGTIAAPTFTTTVKPLILAGGGKGNVGNLHMDGDFILRQSWANDTAAFEIFADTFNNSLAMRATGLAVPRMAIDLDIGLGGSYVYKIGGQQVVGPRGAAVADATDAASVITQLNALLSRLRAHGLITP